MKEQRNNKKAERIHIGFHVLILLVVLISFSVPLWLQYFDRGEQRISAESFYSGKGNGSDNMIITGIPLFEYSCRSVQKESSFLSLRDSILSKVTYYVPLVDSTWNRTKIIKGMLEFSADKPWNDTSFAAQVHSLDSLIIAFSQSKFRRQTFKVSCFHYQFADDGVNAEEYLQKKYNLKFASWSKDRKLIVNYKVSSFFFLFMTIFTIVAYSILGLIVYKRYKSKIDPAIRPFLIRIKKILFD